MRGTKSILGWSGTVILIFSAIYALVLLCLWNLAGWERAWRMLGVPAVALPFVDMHHVTDHAACTAKEFNAYIFNECDPLPLGPSVHYIRDPFNYPPVWLWLGYFGIGSGDAVWLSAMITIAAFAVVVVLLRSRSIYAGALSSLAILSPSVMFGVERGNIDLLILGLVGAAALIIAEHRTNRMVLAVGLVSAAILLKLYPLFCVAIAARYSKRTLIFSAAVGVLSLVYMALIFDYVSLIRQNTPSMYFASYGYQVPFLGLDQLLGNVGKNSSAGLASTWLPLGAVVLTLILAGTIAACAFRCEISQCLIPDNAAGSAFLFGAGIYCGSFLLGANFDYRLMFLLLCLPQVLDWLAADSVKREPIAWVLLIAILGALWLNPYPFASTNRMPQPGDPPILMSQLLNWSLFLGLTILLFVNFLKSAKSFVITPAR